MQDRPTCPICQSTLPKPSRRGRPRVFCSATCRSRARTRANQAARLLELADVVETRVGNPVFGSVAYLRARATRLREDAAALVRRIPDATPPVGDRPV